MPAAGRSSTLQKRIFALVLTAVLPALAIQCYSDLVDDRRQEAQIEAEVLRTAQYVAGDIDRIVETNRALLVAMAGVPAVRDFDPAGCNAYATALAEQFPMFEAFGMVDREGTPFCIGERGVGASSGPWHFDARGWATTQRARRDPAFIVSTYLQTTRTKRPMVPTMLPLRDGSGQFAGAVSSGLSLTWLNRYLADKPLPPDGIISITDRDGTAIARSPVRPEYLGAAMAPAKIMAEAARKPEPGKRSQLAAPNLPVHRVGCCSPDLNANLPRLGIGRRDLVEPQLLRAAMAEIPNSLHER